LKNNEFLPGLIYNLDETSLQIKVPSAPTVLSHSSKFRPTFSRPEQVYGATVIFIVDASGGHCPATLILNSKADLQQIKNYINVNLDVRF
jgi:hypothetical protein